MSAFDPRRELREVGRMCYDQGLVAGTAGNLSTRLHLDAGDPEVLLTASGTCLGRLTNAELLDVMVTDTLDVPGHTRGRHKPTSELALHLAIYRDFHDIGAIVHTHSPAATAFACLGRQLPLLTTEGEVRLRRVPVVPLRPPGSKELALETVSMLKTLDQEGDFDPRGGAALLERHGVICWASRPIEAFYIAELVEHMAQVAIYNRQLVL